MLGYVIFVVAVVYAQVKVVAGRNTGVARPEMIELYSESCSSMLEIAAYRVFPVFVEYQRESHPDANASWAALNTASVLTPSRHLLSSHSFILKFL